MGEGGACMAVGEHLVRERRSSLSVREAASDRSDRDSKVCVVSGPVGFCLNVRGLVGVCFSLVKCGGGVGVRLGVL